MLFHQADRATIRFEEGGVIYVNYISIFIERFGHVIHFTHKEGHWIQRNSVWNHLHIYRPDIFIEKDIIDNSKLEWYSELDLYMELGDCLFDVDWKPVEDSGFVKACKIIKEQARKNRENKSTRE